MSSKNIISPDEQGRLSQADETAWRRHNAAGRFKALFESLSHPETRAPESEEELISRPPTWAGAMGPPHGG